MKGSFTYGLRNRAFVVVVHLALWGLLYLALRGLSGHAPELREAEGFSETPVSAAPVAKIDNLFASGIWPKLVINSNSPSPFQTTHYIPLVAPPVAPPTTKKIELTYQGFYQSEAGIPQVMVKLGDSFLVVGVGKKLTGNLYAARAVMQSLLLTNNVGQTNLLLLNTKKEIVVPLP